MPGARVLDLSDQLKRLMDDDDVPRRRAAVVILPADIPLVEPIDFDLQDSIDTAHGEPPELGQQIVRIRNAEITEDVGAEQPAAAAQLHRLPVAAGRGSNPGQALKGQRQWDDISSSVGLEFEMPIGNRAARAIYRRVQLQRLQAIEQYQNLIDQVQADVKTALREVNTPGTISSSAARRGSRRRTRSWPSSSGPRRASR